MEQVPPVVSTPPQSEEVLPLAAVCATDIKREDETVHGLLKEPERPKEIVIVTKPDMPVPPLPVDLMELLSFVQGIMDSSLSMVESLCDVDASAVLSQVDNLIGKYRAGDVRSPLHTIISMMAKTCGAGNVEIKPDDVGDTVDVRAVLENLYSCVDPESSAYFLVNKEAKYKKFSQRFQEMWKYLVKSSFSADILFEDAMLPTVAIWLVAMSESKCRSFRHTSTLAVMHLVQALNELAESLKARLSFIQTADQMPEVKENLDQVVKWRDHLFSQTVHQRLRDVAPEIRLAAIQHLKKWTLDFPDEFMEKQYLRYFGMPLHDKRPTLRAEALDMILQSLGRVEGAFSKMKLFLEYFIKRIVEMSNDADTKCAELALRVMAMIVKRSAEYSSHNPNQEDTISSEMIDAALRSLFDERRSVREAAGVLLHVFVYTRCNGDDNEEEDRLRVCAELICSFAGTLRAQYKENMPEKYIVDALWINGLPPPLLTETKVISELAQSANGEEAVVGLSFLAAILNRLQDHLCTGPTPKDERRTSMPKLTAAKKEQVDRLLANLSAEAVHILSSVLKKGCNDPVICRFAAELLSAVRLSDITTSTDQSVLTGVMAEFHKMTTTTVPLEGGAADALLASWHSLLHSDHPLRHEAEGHVAEMLSQISRQLETIQNGTASSKRKSSVVGSNRTIAERCRILSSLTDISNILVLMEVAFRSYLNASITEEPEITTCVAYCMLNHIMWNGAEAVEALNNTLLLESVGKLVALCSSLPGRQGEKLKEEDAAHVKMSVNIFTALCDVSALPLYTLNETEQDQMLGMFDYIFDKVSAFLERSQEAYRAAQSLKAESVELLHEQLHQSRAEQYAWEAIQLRLVQGVVRLILLQKLSLAAVPKLLFFWTRTTSKNVSSTFKDLFHKVREREEDSFALERDTLAEAYNRCVQLGATPMSVEDMCQIGMKLSSLHFPITTDRYYAACLSMVQYGIEFASSVDPLILLGVLPYCAKLKAPEALHILRHELPAKEIFKTATNPYVRACISALSRAAKVEDPTCTGSSSSSAPAAVSPGTRKRSRDLRGMSESGRPETALDELVESMQSFNDMNPANGHGNVLSRVVTSDGWHVREDELLGSQTSNPMPSQQNSGDPTSLRRSKVNLPSTQEESSSSQA